MQNTAFVMLAGLQQVEAAALDDLVRDVDDVAQHREQVLLDAADHLAVDERDRRRVPDLELDAPALPDDLDLEVLVLLEQLARVVAVAAGVQHRERAGAEQRVEAALPAVEQLVDLLLRQVLEAAARRDARVDEILDRGLGGGHRGRRYSVDAQVGRLRVGFRSGCSCA
jgi:hypothetical protein